MKNQRGFTLPELVIVIGIITILFGFISINLIHLQRHSSLTTTVDTLVSDLYNQQNKAMVGDTEGSGAINDYGVYFEASRYILFRGSSYSSLNTSNFPINLDPSFQFSSVTSVIFSKGSGEVASAPISVILKDTTNNEQKTIQTNVYGAITVQ